VARPHARGLDPGARRHRLAPHRRDARAGALRQAIETARQDSARYVAIHEAGAALRAREDTIRSKVAVITGIDEGRFVWAHLMDEVSRALPEHVWLTEVVFLSDESPLDEPRFAVLGRAGSTFALSSLLQRLDASAFLESVTLVQTAQVMETNARVYSFAIEARYRASDPSLLDVRPVFAVEGE
jgi:Tfp pilus assembly protein PilN